jgi:hypothetical protein
MKDLIQELQASENQIQESHKQWQDKTKPFIVQTLENIKQTYQLQVAIQLNDAITNHETIYFSFGNKPSGLSYNQQNIFNIAEGLNGQLMLKGAALYYSLGYRGEVLIWMSYPSVEGIIEQEDDFNPIRTMTQAEITIESIQQDVIHFFKQVISWNQGEVVKEKIGFKISE